MSKSLNPWMTAAAAAMVLTTLIHIFAGGAEAAAPMRAEPLDPVIRSVLSVIWHGITVILAVFALALAMLARAANPPLEAVLIAVQVGFAGLFLAYGIADLQTVWPMPQWTIFLTIPALMLMGRRRGW